jgi:hypothetical protein
MPNIKFNYLYRDGSNFKNFGSVTFSNPQSLMLDYLNNTVKSKLIDGTWFYANKWNLPDLFLSTFNPNVDPSWHEFESIEFTDEMQCPDKTIGLFLKNI